MSEEKSKTVNKSEEKPKVDAKVAPKEATKKAVVKAEKPAKAPSDAASETKDQIVSAPSASHQAPAIDEVTIVAQSSAVPKENEKSIEEKNIEFDNWCRNNVWASDEQRENAHKAIFG